MGWHLSLTGVAGPSVKRAVDEDGERGGKRVGEGRRGIVQIGDNTLPACEWSVSRLEGRREGGGR